MLALVTGTAGFIGSNLAEALLSAGDTVRGIDSFTDYYDGGGRKRRNIRSLIREPSFTLIEEDLGSADLGSLLEGVDVVYHQAAQPGVRSSWADGFEDYLAHNVMITQRLLEACRQTTRLRRFVYASSSSVYGNATTYPTRESDPLSPHSPYGVTKLAGEQLVTLYGSNFGIPTISLRYHTVYGPRQRPDMATYRLIQAALGNGVFPLYGAGAHIRDFTFVGDVVRANQLAAERTTEPGTVVNIAGGGATTMAELISLVEELTGRPVPIEQLPTQAGDVRQTGGSSEAAERLLGWRPQISLREGVAAQVAWQASLRASTEAASRGAT